MLRLLTGWRMPAPARQMLDHLFQASTERLASVSTAASGVTQCQHLSRHNVDCNMWHPWEVTFTPELKNGTGASEVHFYVKATRGKTWASDIALDNLMVKAGPCINLEQVESERFVA